MRTVIAILIVAVGLLSIKALGFDVNGPDIKWFFIGVGSMFLVAVGFIWDVQ